ncbi:thiamine biosynthesis protein ThiG [Spongiactinospora rosea]|uniref:thiazole synthase n=1 Tax=Spongiactinospora rosea TaxID=2248750 RepID=A0A366LTW3_9ACTN|nr:HisA/HisF-related TIM barrel protein [Spongiactinospora rosea]RBQ16809.1 thiamine biosynthesis protein ThiG [Spongiactinospora rosea]
MPAGASTAEGAGTPWLTVGGRVFRSPMILGIEQYTSVHLIAEVLREGDCDVFITTYDLRHDKPSVLLTDLDDVLDLDHFTWIGTTSYARGKAEALRTARMLHATLGIDIVKLDVRPTDNRPHEGETVEAAAELLDDGFAVLPFIMPDPEVAAELAELGCCALRVMAAPVGTGWGISDPGAIAEVIQEVDIPVIVEGGIGSPEHVVQAMSLGASAVLVNTAVARAPLPGHMARAMRYAALAGQYGLGQTLESADD